MRPLSTLGYLVAGVDGPSSLDSVRVGLCWIAFVNNNTPQMDGAIGVEIEDGWEPGFWLRPSVECCLLVDC